MTITELIQQLEQFDGDTEVNLHTAALVYDREVWTVTEDFKVVQSDGIVYLESKHAV